MLSVFKGCFPFIVFHFSFFIFFPHTSSYFKSETGSRLSNENSHHHQFSVSPMGPCRVDCFYILCRILASGDALVLWCHGPACLACLTCLSFGVTTHTSLKQ